ncbi:zinc-binding protein A33-like [Hemiscyllium ocellatum]|uniref:zinc-binding protein A33-like n=1 Tax=Hemiscyllium ocellatum TaxID=170820 RepID=UPI002966D7C5|nr:zinc-binding protein A33-like [Hemiscyllium ocellatum]
MASSLEVQSLVEELTCPICLSLFTEPVRLQCEHHFCRGCISQCWGPEGSEPLCPQCRILCSDRVLKPNRVLANLVDKLQRLGEQEELKASGEIQCPEHQEHLKLFCRDDRELVCLVCRDDPGHSQHSFLPLKQAASLYKNEFNELLAVEERKQRKRSLLITQQQEKIAELEETSGELLHHLSSEFSKMHQFLVEKEQRLSDELEREKEQCLQTMEENLTAIETVWSVTEHDLSQLRARITQQADCLFLKEFKGLRKRFQEMGQKTEASVVSKGLELGIFKGPLQYTVWKEMFQILSPVPAPLTLDPGTAQARLLLSEDLTAVHAGAERRNLPNNRERFEPCTCVLSSQGFSSGRHYWEVAVANKTDWDLGLARENAQRKGQITLMPSVGYWTICQRREHTYGALTAPSTLLKLGAKPKKVGVYLDYEGGQISFYNADSMTHLYTFTDTFNGKLFPFFNPWLNTRNSEPLKLCHVKL